MNALVPALNYNNSKGESPIVCRQPTVEEHLQERKERLEQQLAEVNEAIAFLKENPKYIEFSDKVGKALRY